MVSRGCLGWQYSEMGKEPSKPNNPEQSKRFVDKAREVEADETEEGADRAFKKVTQPKARIQKSS